MSYFRFDINDATGDLDANRPVPFRLTPNISEFLTSIGVSGPLTASMIAVARCFAQPNFKVGQWSLLHMTHQGVHISHVYMLYITTYVCLFRTRRVKILRLVVTHILLR